MTSRASAQFCKAAFSGRVPAVYAYEYRYEDAKSNSLGGFVVTSTDCE
jgi:hypothetical protein